jgi:hypothetical protein
MPIYFTRFQVKKAQQAKAQAQAQQAKASQAEGISTAKMSRCVKNKTIINDYYYCI